MRRKIVQRPALLPERPLGVDRGDLTTGEGPKRRVKVR